MNATPPRDALHRYLKDKSSDVTDSTLSNYQTTLRKFVDWLEDQGITNLNTLTSDEIQQFKEWRQERVKTITLKTDLTCIKDFVRFCEHINAVPNDLRLMVRIPKPDDSEEVADSVLTQEEASQIIAHLEKHEYASLHHLIVLVLWKTGMRRGSLTHSTSATSMTGRSHTSGSVTVQRVEPRSRRNARANETWQ